MEAAGGFKVQPEKLVSGGPMMGFAIFGLDVPTTKTTIQKISEIPEISEV